MASAISPIRVLVVDDSAYNRRNIADIFAASDEVEVVGKAMDGEEALRLATTLRPDVITLDLEMPKMDGFTFLRILMSKQPTPVIVVSSYSQKENVFKALELGAIDFVAKPDRQISPEAHEVRQQILQKVLLVRNLRPSTMIARTPSARAPAVGSRTASKAADTAPPPPAGAPRHLVVIASSTGGPSALIEIFSKIPMRTHAAVLVAQHMPDKFTRTFAERLDKRGTLHTSEAQDLDVVSSRTGFVCPGRQCMEVELAPVSGDLRLRISPPHPSDRYVPSADRLFRSAAKLSGPRLVGVILTGMGDDGAEGARAIRDAGGTVIAESQETAVVYGMPAAAARLGVVDQLLPLPAIADYLAALA